MNFIILEGNYCSFYMLGAIKLETNKLWAQKVTDRMLSHFKLTDFTVESFKSMNCNF